MCIRDRLYEHFAVERFGHCNFTLFEVQGAFSALATRAFGSGVYLPLIASESSAAK